MSGSDLGVSILLIATDTGLLTPRRRPAISRSIGVRPSRPSIRKMSASASAIARRDCSRIRLNSVDLPTFGRPMMATVNMIEVTVACSRRTLQMPFGYNALMCTTVYPAPDWATIRTVLLDMDGTLLDRAFDDHFYLEALPAHYAAANRMPV